MSIPQWAMDFANDVLPKEKYECMGCAVEFRAPYSPSKDENPPCPSCGSNDDVWAAE